MGAQDFGFIEVFSGDAWVSRCIKANGVGVASFDVRYSDGPFPDGKQDYMNLLTDSGFAFFICNMVCSFC